MSHRPYYRPVPHAPGAILFVHGICGTPRHFDFLLPAVPESWTISNLLLDDHGGSVRDFAKTSMKKWEAQVEGELQKLCSTHSRVILVGYSLGTLLLMAAARGKPQVKGMLLLNPPLKTKLSPKLPGSYLRFAFGKVRREDPRELALYQDVGLALEPRLHKYIPWIPRFLELLKKCRSCRPGAKAISVPCHVFLGQRDELVPGSTETYFQANPHVRLHRMKNAGHSYYPPEDRAAMEKALSALIRLSVLPE